MAQRKGRIKIRRRFVLKKMIERVGKKDWSTGWWAVYQIMQAGYVSDKAYMKSKGFNCTWENLRRLR